MRAQLARLRSAWALIRLIRFIALGVTLALVSGCASDARPSPRSPEIVPSFARACGSDVYGDLGPPRRWQPPSILLGALAFVWIREAAHTTAANIRRAYRAGQGAFKILALVKLGHEVTVSVPAREWRHVALLYDRSKFNRSQTVANGERAVTFRACPRARRGSNLWSRATQFNGGIIVDRRSCVTLEIRDGRHGLTRRISVSFGQNACGASR